MRLERPTVGIHIPGASVAGLADGAGYRAFCAEAEALGFDALWTEDRLLHPSNVADSMTLLTWAAASTERVVLGTAVLLLNLRGAAWVARQVSTLRAFAGDRIALGVSLGGSAAEYAAVGAPFERRVGVFREQVAALRALLEGESVRPAAPGVPLLVGGGAPAAIRRAGELGDGWIMSPFGDLEGFERGRELVRQGAAAAGRDPDELAYGRLLYVAVDDDRERARDVLTTFLHGYYGPRFDVEAQAIFGSASEVGTRLEEQRAAGIEHLMLGVPTLDLDGLRRLAEVLPQIRGAA